MSGKMCALLITADWIVNETNASVFPISWRAISQYMQDCLFPIGFYDELPIGWWDELPIFYWLTRRSAHFLLAEDMVQFYGGVLFLHFSTRNNFTGLYKWDLFQAFLW